MEELNEFQIRLERINEEKLGRRVEDIGINELTDMRDDYNDLLTDIESFVKASRLDIDNYEDDELARIIITASRLKTEIKDKRVDIIAERLVKEKTIVNLNNEREQLSKTEKALSNYVFADEDNLSEVEKTIRELQLSIPKRKEEIDKELDELRFGRTAVEEKKPTRSPKKYDENGEYIGKHELPRKEEELPLLPSADNEEETLPLPPVVDEEKDKEEDVNRIAVPIIDNNENLAASEDETADFPPLLNEDEEMPEELGEEPSVESEEELPPELGEEEMPAPLEEEIPSVNPINIDPDDEPVDVEEVVQPKPSLWKKIGTRVALAAAALAALLALLHNKKSKDTNKDTNNEEKNEKQEEKKEEEIPAEDYEKKEEKKEDKKEEPAPKKKDEPTPEKKDKDGEEYIPIKLEAGEAAYDRKTGVEITSDGSAYQHDKDGVTELEDRELGTDRKGYAVVEDEDFKDTTPAHQSTPKPESSVGIEERKQQLINEGNVQEAANLEMAADAINWDDIFNSGPTL